MPYPNTYVPLKDDRASIEADARFYQDLSAAFHELADILMRRADTAYFAYDEWELFRNNSQLHAAKARLALGRLLR